MAEKVAWRKSHVISTGFVSTILVEVNVGLSESQPHMVYCHVPLEITIVGFVWGNFPF